MPGWLVILFLFSLIIDNVPCDNNFTKRYSMNLKKKFNIKIILSNGGFKELNRIMKNNLLKNALNFYLLILFSLLSLSRHYGLLCLH